MSRNYTNNNTIMSSITFRPLAGLCPLNSSNASEATRLDGHGRSRRAHIAH
jgi:hypothetical protein